MNISDRGIELIKSIQGAPVLIVCSTWLAHDRILDSAAWIALITNVGGLWGLAAAAGTPGVRDVIAKMTRGPE